MIPLQITVDLDRNPWDDIPEGVGYADVTRIGFVPNMTTEGKPGVVLWIVGTDGEVYLASTTWRLLRLAARVFAVTPAGLLIEEEGE